MSSHTATSQPKRPSMPSRHSSTSIYTSRSSSSNLSSSAQKAKSQRHVVYPRIGPSKGPPLGKGPNNINSKATKITFTQPSDPQPSSPKLHQGQRNSSNSQLARNHSSQDLKRNHSETSLKKNRSSAQLMKLTKSHSSKNLTRTGKHDTKSRRQQLKNSELLTNPTVRFDLGDDDDAWTEDSGTQSPNTTRSNTERNSLIIEPALGQKTPGTPDEQSPPQSPKVKIRYTSHAPETDAKQDAESEEKENREPHPRRTRPPDAGMLTSRLLKRNVSFNAAPEVTNVSASAGVMFNTKAPASSEEPSGEVSRASSIHQGEQGDEDSEHRGENDELVSRFLSGTGSSNLTADSGSFQSRVGSHPSPEAAADVRRNRSLPNVQRQLSRSSSQHSGVFTPVTTTPKNLGASRTQEKLWLERASANIEPQPVHPVNLYRGVRFPGAGVQFGADAARANPQLRQMIDQTDIEYRRVRLFQNPLADAVRRLQDSGAAPRTKIAARSKAKGADGKMGLSQSWKSQKSGAEAKKPKVTFQGIKESKTETDLDGRTLIDEEGSEPREDPREICRRLWDTQTSAEAE